MLIRQGRCDRLGLENPELPCATQKKTERYFNEEVLPTLKYQSEPLKLCDDIKFTFIVLPALYFFPFDVPVLL
jgi:hypothetical protein